MSLTAGCDLLLDVSNLLIWQNRTQLKDRWCSLQLTQN